MTDYLNGDDQKGIQKGLTRRELLERGAAAGVLLVAGSTLLGACGSSGTSSTSGSSSPGAPAAEKVTLTFVSYGGGYQAAQTKAWLDPFMKLHPNVTIIQDESTDYAKIKAMVEAGNVTWDVVDISGDFGYERDASLLEPIDTTIVTAKPIAGVEATQWRAAEQLGGYNIVYRTDKYPQGPQNWADWYNLAKFPGKRTHWGYVYGGVIESALLADGVPKDQLYPLDMNRALRKLDTIKKEIIWWQSGAQSTQLLADGEAPMGALWNGRGLYLINQGEPVKLVWNEAIVFDEFFAVPKGSKNVKTAMELIAYMTSLEHNADLSNYWPCAPATQGSDANVAASVRPNIPTTYLSEIVIQNDQWWAANIQEADKQFQAWLQS